MFKKVISVLPFLIIGLSIILVLSFSNDDDQFRGLTPKAVHNGYYIYDLVEQKNLVCAEAIEVIGTSRGYEYYFNCIKSEQVFLVRDNVVMTVNEALERNLIYLEHLYGLGIVDRMEVPNE